MRQMRYVRPLQNLKILSVPADAIDAGIQDIKIARMLIAHILDAAIHRIQHAAMCKHGNFTMTGRTGQARDAINRTRGKLTQGLGTTLTVRVTRIDIATLPGGVILRILFLDFRMVQTFEGTEATLTQTLLGQHCHAARQRHCLRRIVGAQQIAGIDRIQRLVQQEAA
ncbi:hypothetical protein D3C81_1529910 [compost metagenome]